MELLAHIQRLKQNVKQIPELISGVRADMQNISWKFWIKTFIVLPFDHCDYVRKCNHFHQYIRKCNHFHLYVRKCDHFHLYVRKCNHFHLYYLPFYNQDFFKFTILKFVLKGIIYTVFNRVAKWFFLKISNVTFELLTLHKKWSFPLRISSVNVTKSTDSCGFGHIYWRNPSCKTSFFCAVWHAIASSSHLHALCQIYKNLEYKCLAPSSLFWCKSLILGENGNSNYKNCDTGKPACICTYKSADYWNPNKPARGNIVLIKQAFPVVPTIAL